MQTQTDAPSSGDAEHPFWRPRPGEVLAGVIDRYTISDTPQGPVRTVIVTEERTGQAGQCTARLDELAVPVRAASTPHGGTD